ncbi:MAG: hypothetical protein AB1679_28700, partial [Actinomycetota bacterium]
MPQHRSLVPNVIRTLLANRRRLVTGAIGAISVSGLVLGGLAGPASAAALPNNVTLEQFADVGSTWVTGALGLNGTGASTYEEGETVPFRLNVTSAGAGTFDFSVCRDYMNGDVRGYLSLQPYDTSFSGSASLLSGSETDAAEGSAQPFTGAAAVGSVYIDSVHEVGGQGACGAGQRETEVQITIAGGPGGVVAGAYVLWGGRLASPADAGVGPANGARHIPGGRQSKRLGGSAKNVGIKTEAIIQLGTITVQKVVDSGSATADQFCFNIMPNPYNLAPQCPSPGQDTVSFVGLATGSYSVTEVGVTGYTFASGAGSTANCGIVAGVATASVASGNTPTNATCVFHNRREAGTLTLNQVIDPSDDPGRFNLQIDGTTAGTGADVGHGGTTGAITVSSGSHGVGHTAGTGTDLDDYSAPSITCTDGTNPVPVNAGNVTVADGQNVVCTITVNREPIIIVDPPTTTTTALETTTTTVAPTTTTTALETTTTTVAPTTTTTALETTTTT